MRPFFFGPRHTIAASWSGSMKPIDMTQRLSSTYTGDQPEPLLWTEAPVRPSMRGIEGPVMSMSNTPTCFPLAASENASCAANVLFPTPPFPESTRIV